MRRKLFIAAAVGFLLVAADAKDDNAKLQGAWQAVSSSQGGRDDPEANQHTMIFEKDTVVIKRGGQTFVKGTFKLAAGKSPKQIDITIEEGPDNHKGKTAQGIYELKDGGLKWVTAPPGASERPTGFGATDGTKNMLVVFERAKK